MKKKILVFSLVVLLGIFIFLLVREKNKVITEKKQEFRGIFISYLEYFTYFNNRSNIDIQTEINKMINNIKKEDFNSIILQVRPFSDAIYTSNIYPCSYVINGTEKDICSFDILDYFVKEGKKIILTYMHGLILIVLEIR